MWPKYCAKYFAWLISLVNKCKSISLTLEMRKLRFREAE